MLIDRLGNLFHNVPGLRRRETELICRAHGVLKSGSSALISDEHALIDALSGHYRRNEIKRWRQLQSVNPGHVWTVNKTVVELVVVRSEEHTSELQALMRISYACFCLKKKKEKHTSDSTTT